MTVDEYINSFHGKVFEWGSCDCYTFVRGWIDEAFPNNKLPKLKYNSVRGAHDINLKFDWVVEIKKAFRFEIVDNAEDGDLFIIKDGFQCAHLVGSGRIFSLDKYLGLVGTDINLLTNKSFIRLVEAY